MGIITTKTERIIIICIIIIHVNYPALTHYTIIRLKYVYISLLANCRSQCLLVRLGKCHKLFVSTDSPSCNDFAFQFGLAIFVYAKIPKSHVNRVARASVYLNEPATGHDWSPSARRKGAVTASRLVVGDPSNIDNLDADKCGHIAATGWANKSKRRQREFIPSQPEQLPVRVNNSDTAALVFAFLLSRLANCNSLLSGCPRSLILGLQKVQNYAARLILGISKREHISLHLASLHWLPIDSRIKYKLACIYYNCMYTNSPPYLTELLTVYTAARQLCSSSDNSVLRRPSVRIVSYGQKSFAYSAPSSWNFLPQQVRSFVNVSTFRSRTKTHLFRIAY